MYNTYIVCIGIDSIMKMGKKYPQVYLEQWNFKIKKIKMPRFTDVAFESDSSYRSSSGCNSLLT